VVLSGRFILVISTLALAAMGSGPATLLAERNEPHAARSSGHIPLDLGAINETLAQTGPGYRLMETRRFAVLSNCDARWTRARAELFERTFDQFSKAMARLDLVVQEPEHKLVCLLINDHADYAAFARTHDGVEARWIPGYYASQSNRVVFYNDETSPAFTRAARRLEEADRAITIAERERFGEDRPGRGFEAEKHRRRVDAQRAVLVSEVSRASDAKAIHEAVHLIAFNCGIQSRSRQYPLWLTEGLATVFETEEPYHAFGPLKPMERRDQELAALIREDRLISFAELVAMNSIPATIEPEEADLPQRVYAQSHSLFAWLYRYETEALSGYLRDIADERPGRISPRRHSEMFEARFGDPRALQRQWERDERRRLGLR